MMVPTTKLGTPAAASAPSAQASVRWFDSMKCLEFWLTTAVFGTLQGVGSGVFIANLGLLSASLGHSEWEQLNTVTQVSIFNCVGRLLSGFLMDLTFTKLGTPRCSHFLFTGLGMVCTTLVLATTPMVLDSFFEFTTALLLVGIVYGANWAILPAHLASRFGRENLALNFCVCTSVMGLSVTVLSQVTGRVYDSAGGEKCHASDCFQQAHGVGCAVASVGTLCAWKLWMEAKRATINVSQCAWPRSKV